jgi:hypothetical protein
MKVTVQILRYYFVLPGRNFTKRSGEFSSLFLLFRSYRRCSLTYSLFIKAKLLIDNKGWKENFKENGHWDNGLTGPPWSSLMGRSDSISATEIFKLNCSFTNIYRFMHPKRQ